jgi:repressor LexA
LTERGITVQMSGMSELPKRQRQVLDYLKKCLQNEGICPTNREICAYFGFKSPGTVADHIIALRKKGYLSGEPGLARSLRIVSPFGGVRRPLTAEIPLFGSIPAGPADRREQEAKGCIRIDINTLGFKPNARTMALEVRGDSMIGKCIMDGDNVVLDCGKDPRHGDIVAALIDGESTLKTFVAGKGGPRLKAENPKYKDLIPASELVIQGVVVMVIRKLR